MDLELQVPNRNTNSSIEQSTKPKRYTKAHAADVDSRGPRHSQERSPNERSDSFDETYCAVDATCMIRVQYLEGGVREQREHEEIEAPTKGIDDKTCRDG